MAMTMSPPNQRNPEDLLSGYDFLDALFLEFSKELIINFSRYEKVNKVSKSYGYQIELRDKYPEESFNLLRYPFKTKRSTKIKGMNLKKVANAALDWAAWFMDKKFRARQKQRFFESLGMSENAYISKLRKECRVEKKKVKYVRDLPKRISGRKPIGRIKASHGKYVCSPGLLKYLTENIQRYGLAEFSDTGYTKQSIMDAVAYLCYHNNIDSKSVTYTDDSGLVYTIPTDPVSAYQSAVLNHIPIGSDSETYRLNVLTQFLQTNPSCEWFEELWLNTMLGEKEMLIDDSDVYLMPALKSKVSNQHLRSCLKTAFIQTLNMQE